ncbi:hypothetical protein QBC37DRAFT_377745 [Rhypophila decipiens]|uniref:Secreted protein n=1 Tax=Rhypophila decipiens TaxID=261697 RepID=A0AAN6XZZ3_9PEZI|nr:hypothetical protein QBC37DRAFT_377745 [Rhypophila decipiens]
MKSFFATLSLAVAFLAMVLLQSTCWATALPSNAGISTANTDQVDHVIFKRVADGKIDCETNEDNQVNESQCAEAVKELKEMGKCSVGPNSHNLLICKGVCTIWLKNLTPNFWEGDCADIAVDVETINTKCTNEAHRPMLRSQSVSGR